MSYDPEQFSIPEQPSGAPTVKSHHAGKIDDPTVREVGVVEYDNTLLLDAAAQGKVLERDSLGPVEGDPLPITEEEEENARAIVEAYHKQNKKEGMSLKTKIIAGLAGTAVLAGTLLGIKAATDSNEVKNPVPTPEQTNAGPAVPGQNETALPSPRSTEIISSLPSSPNTEGTDLTLETLEIETGQTPEALAADFIHTISEWNNAGGEEAKALFSQTDNATLEGIAQQVAAQNKIKYAPILFGPNYSSNPSLKKFADEVERANAVTIAAYLSTDPTIDPANEEYYKRNYAVETVISRDNTSTNGRTIDISTYSSSNYKKTRFKNKQTDAQDALKQTYTVNFIPNNTVEIARDITVR